MPNTSKRSIGDPERTSQSQQSTDHRTMPKHCEVNAAWRRRWSSRLSFDGQCPPKLPPVTDKGEQRQLNRMVREVMLKRRIDGPNVIKSQDFQVDPQIERIQRVTVIDQKSLEAIPKIGIGAPDNQEYRGVTPALSDVSDDSTLTPRELGESLQAWESRAAEYELENLVNEGQRSKEAQAKINSANETQKVGTSGPQLIAPNMTIVDRNKHQYGETGATPTRPIIKSGRMFGSLDQIATDPDLDPPHGSCFNCWEKKHHLKDCPDQLNTFCRNCGRRNVLIDSCPRCARVFPKWLRRKADSKNSKGSKIQEAQWTKGTLLSASLGSNLNLYKGQQQTKEQTDSSSKIVKSISTQTEDLDPLEMLKRLKELNEHLKNVPEELASAIRIQFLEGLRHKSSSS
ncbi:uncharacterized protein LOC122503348 [Leptopilina heterotoma]|uniref:uncharacterized protein LOC122503348 n=1 Tax=Leptopilina heterotoma TaxID=63436 RepID=UPI001CA7C28F|nr:uncharacterized protein LOC122503348 [Leptopilina heterotoma]